MAERFQPVFTLPENLYTPGAPVRILSGALLRDTQTGQVFAQITMQNLDPRPVKGVKVVLRPLDIAGRPLGVPTVFPYLDYAAERGARIGESVMIPFADYTVRGFNLIVTEVIFADNTVWAVPGDAAWTPMDPQKPLADALGDPEMVKQYQLRFGADAAFLPDHTADLWRCACGGVNRAGEAACFACGKQAGALFAPELMQELEQEKDARLEAERQKAEADRAAAEARAEQIKKILKIAIPALVAVIAVVLLVTKLVIPSIQYSKAGALMESKDYGEAAAVYETLGSFRQSDVKHAEALELDGQTAKAAIAYYQLRDKDPEYREHSFALWDEAAQRHTICVGDGHAAAILADGTAVAGGSNDDGQCDVEEWTDLVDIAAGNAHTIGLRSDGTVVAAGNSDYYYAMHYDTTASYAAEDIVQVAAGNDYTILLRADGTVDAYGEPDGQDGYEFDIETSFSDWTDIIAIAAGSGHAVGLKADGTVIAVGENDDGQCSVEEWTDIVAIAASGDQTIGIRADGSVVTTCHMNPDDRWNFGQYDVEDWSEITTVATGWNHTIGLRRNGRVVAVGYTLDGACKVDSWRDVVDIAAGGNFSLGLRKDGTVYYTGELGEYGSRRSGSWYDIDEWENIKVN